MVSAMDTAEGQPYAPHKAWPWLMHLKDLVTFPKQLSGRWEQTKWQLPHIQGQYTGARMGAEPGTGSNKLIQTRYSQDVRRVEYSSAFTQASLKISQLNC